GAAALYEKTANEDAKHADALHMLGVARFQLGRAAAAIEALEQALPARPPLPEARGNLATVLQSLGRTAEAERALREALRDAPDTAAFHFNLGNLMGEMDRPREAIDAYTAAVRLQPVFPEALSNLGTT